MLHTVSRCKAIDSSSYLKALTVFSHFLIYVFSLAKFEYDDGRVRLYILQTGKIS